MSDRYCVMGQFFITDGTATISTTGRKVADTNFTCVGAGNFTIYMTQGITGTCAGTNVQGTPVTLSAGLNTITTTGAVADGVIDITIGTAANWNSVQSWSATSGGVGGASVPTSADNVYFNANSFTAGSQVVTVNATAYCLNMDWTGSLNTPTLTLSGANTLDTYGNVTLITAMACGGGTGYLAFNAAGQTFTTNGLSLTCNILISNVAVSSVTLAGAPATLTTSKVIALYSGALTTSNFTVNCAGFVDAANALAKTLTLGTSTINCTYWVIAGTNWSIPDSAYTINVSGTGPFTGGSLSYRTVNLNGTAHTISGSNTFNTLTFKADTTQTITFTAGTTQTITTPTFTGSVGKVKTLTGSGTWYLVKAGNPTLTVGAPVYISAATAGAITSTKPATATNIQRIIGYGNAANELYFTPDGYWVVA